MKHATKLFILQCLAAAAFGAAVVLALLLLSSVLHSHETPPAFRDSSNYRWSYERPTDF